MRNIIRMINKARRKPPSILIKIVTERTKSRIRRCTIIFHPVKLSDKTFLNALEYKTEHDFLISPLPLFFFNITDNGKIVELLKKEYPNSIAKTLKDADKICNHIFDLLGSGKQELGKEIDWHLDFKTGFRWNPKEYYLWTRKHVDCYLKKGIHADVKKPWKLSRCQHFVTLGKAYRYTFGERYIISS
jgi:hypothetical protein